VHCVPPAVTTWWDQDRLGANSLTRVSVGPITCPVSYSTVTTSIENESSTYVACCPPGYTFVTLADVGITGQCSSVIPAGRNVSFATRDDAGSWFTTTTSFTTASPAWGIQINGYNINQVTSTSTTSSSTSSNTSSGGTAGPSPQPSSGISTGAKAGIGVGVAVVAIAALGALVFFILAKRRRRTGDYSASATGPTSELAWDPRKENNGQAQIHELGDRQDAGVIELDGHYVPAEMHSRNYHD